VALLAPNVLPDELRMLIPFWFICLKREAVVGDMVGSFRIVVTSLAGGDSVGLADGD